MAGSDQAGCEQAAAQALAVAPWSYRVRTSLLACLRPRWGGSYRRMAEVVDEAEPYMEVNPKLAALRGYAAWDYGQLLALNGRHHEAIELYECALAAGEMSYYYEDRAAAYSAVHRDAEALEDLDRALALFPQDTDALVDRARTWVRLGDFDRGRKDLARATKLEPTHSLVRADSGDRILRWAVQPAFELHKAGDQDRAIEAFAKIAESAPGYAEPVFYLGAASWKKQDYRAALDYFDRATSLEPDNFEWVRSIDRMLSPRGEWEHILTYWGRYLAVVHDNPQALYERAATLHHAGRPEDSLGDLQASCTLGLQEACSMVPRMERIVEGARSSERVR